MSSRTLYLIRHGHYRRSNDSDERDGELTETGRQQAALVGQRLSVVPATAIYHSTSIRAEQTAELIAKELPDVPVRPTEALKECVPSRPQYFPETYRSFFESLSDSRVTDGKTHAAAALKLLFRADGDEDTVDIVVTHGNLIAYLACQAVGAPTDSWIRTDMYHCAITHISMSPERGLMMIAHNDIGHVPPDMQTAQ